ncbi:MAG: hypothetical protein PHT59_06475 [Candidatus Omnitrophica bacterium]|nr:hypothetical protein [Candidatus Omnitrophota bacterium]
MATAIKTLLLNALKADVTAITAYKSVSLNPMTLPKGDDTTKTRPFACIIDMPEDEIVEDNRYRQASFDLTVISYLHVDLYESLSTDLTEAGALLYQTLVSPNATHRGYSVRIKEKADEKMFFSEYEGCMINTFRITYKHARGNPYIINPLP